MKRFTLMESATACFWIAPSAALFATDSPPEAGIASTPVLAARTAAAKPAAVCLKDVRDFNDQMQKDGYWLGGSGYAYGYPMGGIGYGSAYPMGGYPAVSATGFQSARPGYEARILVMSANILARNGQQKPCEDVLAVARDSYKIYVAELRRRGVPEGEGATWRQQQIAGAQPVTNDANSFRSDELLDTDVRNTRNEALGTVHDLVMSPKTGKIAYLVIGRGGLFGIDEKYVAVPWADFKITQSVNLLVLDASKAAMDAAPQESDHEVLTPAQFDQASATVDAYWKTHLTN